MFLEASRTTALLAAAVPLVIPSSFSMSVSFKSAEPMMKEVPAVIAPVAVTLRRLAMSMFASATRALFAAAVPLVMPSSFSISTSLRSAEPMMKEVPAVIEPVAAIATFERMSAN